MKRGEWTTTELAFLRDHAGDGALVVAEVLDRSVNAVRMMAKRHGISLRRRDEYRGRWSGEIPEAHETVNRLRRVGAHPHITQPGRLKPCPKCGNPRPLVPASGFCRTCHVRWLEEELAAATEAAREYETAVVGKDVLLHREKRDRDATEIQIECPACSTGFTALGRPPERRIRWKEYICPSCQRTIAVRLVRTS